MNERPKLDEWKVMWLRITSVDVYVKFLFDWIEKNMFVF